MRCRSCAMPDTRPDTPFIDGECSACVSYKKRPTIDWEARKAELIALLDRHDGRCIVPSSGGKDSTYQVMTLLELGADVTVVTATTCHPTHVGRQNIDNLSRHARTIEVSPNKTTRAKLNRLGLELVGDISWPEHAAIFSTPFRLSADLKIPLIFYGENPQDQYGGPVGSNEAKSMTRRWVSEFGGFLGLRPSDFVGVEGITERDMRDYSPEAWHDLGDYGYSGPEAHFLGQYIPWDSRRNADVAMAAGMTVPCKPPARGNWWAWENLDNAQTGIHDYFMWLKYGFGRGCQQISVDVRAGEVSREDALKWVEENDGAYPQVYMGVQIEEVLDNIGMKKSAFDDLCEQYRAG